MSNAIFFKRYSQKTLILWDFTKQTRTLTTLNQ
nr:MAG TPA: hypothetical protein [Caudoviricetes sp.]